MSQLMLLLQRKYTTNCKGPPLTERYHQLNLSANRVVSGNHLRVIAPEGNSQKSSAVSKRCKSLPGWSISFITNLQVVHNQIHHLCVPKILDTNMSLHPFQLCFQFSYDPDFGWSTNLCVDESMCWPLISASPTSSKTEWSYSTWNGSVPTYWFIRTFYKPTFCVSVPSISTLKY